MTVDGQAQAEASFEQSMRVVTGHTGQRRLPWRVAQAIRSITRARSGDAAVWLAAARCLRHTSRRAWAFRCYRRAVRLAPEDFALAEEVGMFGATILGSQWSRSWPRYLVAARRDPDRRVRVDPVLLRLARRLPAEASGLLAIACLFALMGGAWIVRRFRPIGRSLPEGFEPFPPYAGLLGAAGVLLGFIGLSWLLVSPVRRFGPEVLHRAFWPPRVVHLVAMISAVASVVLTLVVAWYGARHETFEALAGWPLGCYAITLLLALLGVPAETRVQALIALIGESLKR